MAKTTCDWTVERLPWWANGTLEEAEAERVEAHLAECAECRDELAATRRALALYSVHLPVETLLDLVEDEAAESFRTADGAVLSRVAVDEHLGHCPACREELALARESRAAVEGEAGAATVTELAPRRAAPAPPAGRGRGPGRRSPGRRSLGRRSLALAASLLLFAVAAGGWLATGMTAERRADRIAELERRLDEALAAAPAAEPSDEPTAPDEAAEETRAALEAAAAREAAQAAEIADLQAELERLRPAAEGGERLAEAIGAGPTAMWQVQPTVTRDGGQRPAAQPIDVPAGADHFSFFVTDVPDEPLRLVVEDAASGRRLVEDLSLTPYDLPDDVPDLGRHVGVTLSLADLPAGDLRLRLFAGGEEIGSRLLRIAP